MKENLRNTTGITLVALVITIIILLILATVTIRIVLSEGIIKRAENATENYNSAQTNELAQLDNLEKKMKDLSGEKWWKPTEQEDSECLSEEGGKIVAQTENQEIIVNYMYAQQGEQTLAVVLILKDNVRYIYVGTQATAEFFMEESYTNPNLSLEGEKWYITDNDSSLFYGESSEYTGSCPISMSDFEESEIYSRSYLQKIIDNF